MTTVLEPKATVPTITPALRTMQDIPLAHIQESKTNPRRQFDEGKLAELAANIRLHGVLQPVLVRPLRQLREWIEREVHLDLTNAPFDTDDDNLLPAAGNCMRCLKRTGTNPLLFPEAIGQKKSICTDRTCYRSKVEALVQLRVKPLEESGEKPLRVSQVPAWQANGPKPDVLYSGQYRTAKKAECPQTKPAVVIDGTSAGTILHVCRDEKCPVHAQATRYQPTPEERAARAKELLAERVEKQTRLRILDAVRKKLPATLSRADLEMVALDYFQRLGHDNHRRICRVYQWEEKKTKTAWGAQAVDYEGVARKAVREMSNSHLQHFLVVCSLASDLYYPGYDPRQPLGKDSNLAQAAAHYKVDTAKLGSEVKAELSKKNDKRQASRMKVTKTKKTT